MAKFRALHTASFLQLHMAGFAAKFECPLFTQIDSSGLPSGSKTAALLLSNMEAFTAKDYTVVFGRKRCHH